MLDVRPSRYADGFAPVRVFSCGSVLLTHVLTDARTELLVGRACWSLRNAVRTQMLQKHTKTAIAALKDNKQDYLR